MCYLHIHIVQTHVCECVKLYSRFYGNWVTQTAVIQVYTWTENEADLRKCDIELLNLVDQKRTCMYGVPNLASPVKRWQTIWWDLDSVYNLTGTVLDVTGW